MRVDVNESVKDVVHGCARLPLRAAARRLSRPQCRPGLKQLTETFLPPSEVNCLLLSDNRIVSVAFIALH